MRWSARVLIAAVVLPGIVTAGAAQRQPANAQRPNVVLIITDDVGYGDFGSYGAPDIKTPNIDRLAKEGVKLTDFYAAPLCTPTRASLITGRYQQRVQLERALGNAGAALEQGLTPTGRSLPQLLKNNGYATGLIGKWHLGYKPEFGPNAHGFDYFFGFLSGFIDFYTHTRGGDGVPDLFENTAPVQEQGYMTDLITAHARSIHRRSARRDRSSWKSPTTPHTGRSSHRTITRRHPTTVPFKVRRILRRRPGKTTRRCWKGPISASGRSCRNWKRWGWRGTPLSSSRMTTVANGYRAMRRSFTGRTPSGKAASVCRPFSGGPGGFRPARPAPRQESRWTSRRRFWPQLARRSLQALQALQEHGSRDWIFFQFWRAAHRSLSVHSSGASISRPASRGPSGWGTGSFSWMATICCCTTCGRILANEAISR